VGIIGREVEDLDTHTGWSNKFLRPQRTRRLMHIELRLLPGRALSIVTNNFGLRHLFSQSRLVPHNLVLALGETLGQTT